MTALTACKPPRSTGPAGGGAPPIRLLIVDDSSVARAVLSRMMGAQPGIEVAATAASASQAIEVLRGTCVDIILLDLEMPGASGLEALPQIAAAGRGARILIVSSAAEAGAEASVRALALGATDTMPKPGGGLFGGRFAEILAERVRRIGHACAAAPRGPGRREPIVLRDPGEWRPECLAIGASTGGIHAINEFLAGLPRTGLPILITQHLPSAFMPHFARQLAAASGRSARVVGPEDEIEPDCIHLAPGTAHLTLVRRGARVRVRLDTAPAPSGCLPSVDPMLGALGDTYGPGAVAVILSGMGKDGLQGSRELVNRGGVVLAQDEASCAIWGMPGTVARAGLASAVMRPRDLAERVATAAGVVRGNQ